LRFPFAYLANKRRKVAITTLAYELPVIHPRIDAKRSESAYSEPELITSVISFALSSHAMLAAIMHK